jgi:uncharacterized membrane protein YfcA
MRIVLYLLTGLLIGTASGALGVGGGVLLVPALLWIERLEPRTAAGTSLAIVILGLIPALGKYLSERHLDVGAALWVGGAFAVGGYAGASLRVHHLLPETEVRLAFGMLMLYIALRFIISSSSEAALAAAGLFAAGLAWAGYLGLRLLGRRHLSRPRLEDKLREAERRPPQDPDYSI